MLTYEIDTEAHTRPVRPPDHSPEYIEKYEKRKIVLEELNRQYIKDLSSLCGDGAEKEYAIKCAVDSMHHALISLLKGADNCARKVFPGEE